MMLLSLLEAFQTAVESSDKALRAAEEALAAAKIANTQAKEALKAVTEAFVIESSRAIKNNKREESEAKTVKNSANKFEDRKRIFHKDSLSDEEYDEVEDFLMLSTTRIMSISVM